MPVVIITGASKGIGKSTAAKFKEHDWTVINISRSPCPIDGVIHLQADLRDRNFLSTIESDLLSLCRGDDPICLIHNACHYYNDDMTTCDPDKFLEQLEANLIAPRQLNALLIPECRPGSSIIYIGSTLSEKAVRGAASYVICKHAIVGMMRATCQDLSQSGIHTCCVCPGFTNTETLRAHVGDDPAIIDSIKHRVGAERLIEPAEIAELIYYSASNPVINGSVLHAHLGQIEY